MWVKSIYYSWYYRNANEKFQCSFNIDKRFSSWKSRNDWGISLEQNIKDFCQLYYIMAFKIHSYFTLLFSQTYALYLPLRVNPLFGNAMKMYALLQTWHLGRGLRSFLCFYCWRHHPTHRRHFINICLINVSMLPLAWVSI